MISVTFSFCSYLFFPQMTGFSTLSTAHKKLKLFVCSLDVFAQIEIGLEVLLLTETHAKLGRLIAHEIIISKLTKTSRLVLKVG